MPRLQQWARMVPPDPVQHKPFSIIPSIRLSSLCGPFNRSRMSQQTLTYPIADQPAGELIKIGAKIVAHARQLIFQMTEVAVPKELFQEILRLIAGLRAPAAPA
jgi:hypothetical protein